MNYVSKLVYPVVLAAALAVGFSSCGSDDDDDKDGNGNGNGNGGQNENVILLPTDIKYVEEEGDTYTYTFKYDANNRLEGYSDGEGKDMETFSFQYDDKGRLLKFKNVAEEGWGFEYDYSQAGKVIFKTGGNGYDDQVIILDKNGKMEQTQGRDHSAGNKPLGWITYFSYESDKSNNVSVTTDNESTTEYAYDKSFSPFKELNMPVHFMLHDDNWAIQPSGESMLKSVISNNAKSKLIENKEVYEVLETKNNYASKISILEEEYDNKGVLMATIKGVYTVKYKAVKVK